MNITDPFDRDPPENLAEATKLFNVRIIFEQSLKSLKCLSIAGDENEKNDRRNGQEKQARPIERGPDTPRLGQLSNGI